MWSAPWWLGAEIAVTFPTTKKKLIDGQFSKLFTPFILHVSGGSASNGLLPIILLLSHKPLDYKWSGSNDPNWMIPGLFQHRNAGFLLSCHQIRTQLFQWLRQSGLMLKKEERQLIWNSADAKPPWVNLTFAFDATTKRQFIEFPAASTSCFCILISGKSVSRCLC